jgi:hypothetical protein
MLAKKKMLKGVYIWRADLSSARVLTRPVSIPTPIFSFIISKKNFLCPFSSIYCHRFLLKPEIFDYDVVCIMSYIHFLTAVSWAILSMWLNKRYRQSVVGSLLTSLLLHSIFCQKKKNVFLMRKSSVIRRRHQLSASKWKQPMSFPISLSYILV